jgi:serine/threonine protein kinase
VAASSIHLAAHPKPMPATLELLQEGRYRIEQPLAENSNGSVYQAYDTVRNSNVVVKEIVVRLNKVTTLSQQENMKSAFANQAKVLTSIRHDSLLQVEDYFSEVGRQYLVLENVDGDDFQKLLEQNKRPFDVKDIVAWADQLLDGLHYLHNFNPPVIHKNLRPSNVRLTVEGKVKLFAYGLSDGSDSRLTTNLVDDASEATVLNYSPLELIWDGLDAASQKVIVNNYDDRSERVLKEPADARSDIYSLGATLYYLLTAKMPVDPLERSIELLEGNQDPLKAPNKVDARIPVEVSDVVMRAMEIKRENRFDSAVIMRQVLRTAVVRVKERESVESRELEEAAEDLRFAEKVREDQIQKLVQQKSRQIEEEKLKQAEQLQQKLREAEEQRILAEKRAAEAERLLREREADQARAQASADLAKASIASAKANLEIEDDLLGLNTSDAPNVEEKAPRVSTDAPPVFRPERKAEAPEPEVRAFEEPKKEAVIEEPQVEKVEETTQPESEPVETFVAEEVEAAEEKVAFAAEPVSMEPDEAEIAAEEEFLAEPVDLVEESEPFTVQSIHESTEFAFDGAAKSRSGLPVPMIAGVVVVLVFVAIGGWLFLGSSSNEPSPAPPVTAAQTTAEPPVSSEPAASEQPATQNAALPENSFQADSPGSSEPAADTTAPTTKQAAKPTPKPAKAEPAKTPAPKKAVTVDDLISDN